MSRHPSCPTGPRQRRPKPVAPDVLNILANVRRARCTGDLSPAAGLLAWYGWALRLNLSPGKQRGLIEKGLHKQRRFARYIAARCEQPRLPHVHRAIGAGSALQGAGLAIASFKVIHQGFRCSNSGDTTPPPECAACRAITRTWPLPPGGSGRICCRPRTSPEPTSKCRTPSRPAAAPTCGKAPRIIFPTHVSAQFARQADTSACDLVILSAHGRRGVDQLLLGSDAVQVTRIAPVPVTLVRQPHHNGIT